jgi:membrane-associated phospholipid phosphatase
MALSRVLLGVHYPSDVATGVAVGAAVAAITARVDRGFRPKTGGA